MVLMEGTKRKAGRKPVLSAADLEAIRNCWDQGYSARAIRDLKFPHVSTETIRRAAQNLLPSGYGQPEGSATRGESARTND